MSRDLTIASPTSGTVVDLASVEDGVFSAGILGPGTAIHADSVLISAPMAGEITVAMPHAYGIRSADGLEVLVHVGIDTVELDGKGFTSQVSVGDKVAVGDLLAEVDFVAIDAAGYKTAVILIVTNRSDFTSVDITGAKSARVGEPLLSLTR